MRLFAFSAVLIFLANLNEFWKIGEQQGLFIHSDSVYFWLSDLRIFIQPAILLIERYTLFLGNSQRAKTVILAFAISYWLDCLQMLAGGNFSGWQFEVSSVILCITAAVIIEKLKKKNRPKIGFKI